MLGPIYLLLVNTLNTPEAVARWPKSLVPSFDLGSLRFFATYEGISVGASIPCSSRA